MPSSSDLDLVSEFNRKQLDDQIPKLQNAVPVVSRPPSEKAMPQEAGASEKVAWSGAGNWNYQYDPSSKVILATAPDGKQIQVESAGKNAGAYAAIVEEAQRLGKALPGASGGAAPAAQKPAPSAGEPKRKPRDMYDVAMAGVDQASMETDPSTMEGAMTDPATMSGAMTPDQKAASPASGPSGAQAAIDQAMGSRTPMFDMATAVGKKDYSALAAYIKSNPSAMSAVPEDMRGDVAMALAELYRKGSTSYSDLNKK